jgi:ubiquinone/menaquinone biosynthesis C-methylase UbiE
LNWIFKAILQEVLAIVPFGESVNHQLQQIRGSNNPTQVDDGVKHGIEIVKLLAENGLQNIQGKKILEVGTGWLPILPVLFSFLGSSKIYTYDHVPHLRFKLVTSTLLQVEKKFPLISESLRVPIDGLKAQREKVIIDSNLKTFFNSMNISYIAPGDASHTNLPDNSFDLFFSNAVLEHVPEETVRSLSREALRILRPGGLYYNYIGLHDHYVSFDRKISKVNFLKYPEWLWRLLAKNKITYLNRLRNSQFIEIIKNCGFEILSVHNHIDNSSLEALKTMKLDKRFKTLELEDLAVTLSEIVARKIPVSKRDCSSVKGDE